MVQGKRVLVLGGDGSGIGRAIVRRLGEANASVVVAYLQQDRAEYAAADGIRMNVVAGGAISTGVANTASEEWVDEIPVGRYGKSDEIADAALYLLSDISAYVTGQQIVIEGGVFVRGPFA